jgi:hypothetical protein
METNMSELAFSDNLQEATTNMENALKTLRRSSRISTLDIENLRVLVEKASLVKKDMIAIMALQGKPTVVAEQFGITPGRVYQLKIEYLKAKDEKQPVSPSAE